MDRATLGQIFNRLVIVSALGYFVDIYDLLLFGIVRKASLIGIGVTDPAKILSIGITLQNWQMGGLLLGGILWGVLGDKRGRRSVLFGSIALYSVANILNAFVTSVPMYAAARFLAGLGLAGELGAAVTLVSEALPQKLRGYGTSLVAGIGILGAVAGYFVASVNYPFKGIANWQVAFLVGGGLGIALLLARIAISESQMFKETEARSVARGSLAMLFTSGERVKKLVYSTLIGLPIWCTIGILITLSPEIAKSLGVTGPVVAGKAILFCYAFASVGSLVSGSLSQFTRSRKQVVIGFLAVTGFMNAVYYFSRGVSPDTFYWICGFLGFGVGYWSVFVQIAAEQFGTNLRATVTTSVPNLIRGTTIPLTLIFQHWLLPFFDAATSALLILSFSLLVALFCVRKIEETYAKDLDYLEGEETTEAAPDATPEPRQGRPTAAT